MTHAPHPLALVVAITFAGALSACSDVDCSDVRAYSKVSALPNNCEACHSSNLSGGNRNGAPSDINFDTYDAAVAAAGESVREVQGGAMPPSDGPALSDEDKQVLLTWLQCDTPK